MSDTQPVTFFCLASYEKGFDFLRELRHQGCYVILLTLDKLKDSPWPQESIDEFHMIPTMDRTDVINTVSHIARRRIIDRIVPLDDYDVETAAALREHLRVPGMGDTTARYFRDKLAMRVQARDKGLLVPAFIHALNYDQINQFISSVPPPWVLKPRSEAATVGIHKVESAEELWPILDSMGDRQSYYVLEQYIPGDVFHVDALVWDRRVIFVETHSYGTPPLDVVHSGGLFSTRTIRGNGDARRIREMNIEVLGALNFMRGAVHTEFIKSRVDGQFYFLETAARLGGAYIVDLVRAVTGVNMWAEWAKIEIAGSEGTYEPPDQRLGYGGLIISLARQEHPDTSAYSDPEIVWRLDLLHHAGLIVVSHSPERIEELINDYRARFYNDFYAALPAPDKPTS